MYKKIGINVDKKEFGNKVIVYKGERDYFIIEKDREEIVYYFVDKNLVKLYPMISYMKKIGFVYNEETDFIECFDVDLSLYGYTDCPIHLVKIIQNMIN